MAPSQTLTLTTFLLARIAEDEASARAADGRAWWVEGVSPSGVAYIHDAATGKPVSLDAVERHAHHITRHDPERVLAECEAKRAIVGLWQRLDAEIRSKAVPGAIDNEVDGLRMARFGVLLAMKTLALPYADHPDYREEWRP